MSDNKQEYKPNNLVLSLAKYPETFKEARIFLFQTFENNKDTVLKLEQSRIEIALPYYIKYLESKQISITDALLYFKVQSEYAEYNYKFWELLNVCIINIFRKIENKEELTFIPFS